MRASDTRTLAYQHSQKMFHERGYIHRNDPSDFDNDDSKEKTNLMQFKYCKLSKQQMVELENYLMPHIKCLESTLTDLFKETSAYLVTDKDGTIMTEMTFRRMYSKLKNEVLMKKEDIKKEVIDLKNAGLSADEICKKFRNVMRPRYLRPILEECGFGSQKSKTVIVREMWSHGMSYVQINKQRPDISVKYARELDALMNKGKQ